MQTKTEHPYVNTDSKICNGSPVIVDTRVRVVDMTVEYEYMNCLPDDIITAYPHLKPEQMHYLIIMSIEPKLTRKYRKTKILSTNCEQTQKGVTEKVIEASEATQEYEK